MTDKANDIAALLSPTVSALGLELLGIEYLPAPGGATVRLYIDVPQAEAGERSVGIEECEAVSREVSAQLDVEDPISGNYTLEVSSPGIDRPLRTIEHFARYAGQTAVVKAQPLDGRGTWTGTIQGAGEGVVTLDADGSSVQIPLDTIKRAHLKGMIDFSSKA